jgi:hypothetical protein
VRGGGQGRREKGARVVVADVGGCGLGRFMVLSCSGAKQRGTERGAGAGEWRGSGWKAGGRGKLIGGFGASAKVAKGYEGSRGEQGY